MRPLWLVMTLLAWPAAGELRSVLPSTAKLAVLPVETAPAGFRLSGALDVGAVSADTDSFLPTRDISSNAPTSELRTWRVREPLGYYPADLGADLGTDRGFARETERRPLGTPPRFAGGRASF